MSADGPEPMLLATGIELTDDDDETQYPVHVRMDDEILYVDIHVGEKVYATGIPWLGISQLSAVLDRESLALPQLGAPKPGKELLN